MKNICCFNSHRVWGGGEKWHYEMARHLRKRGYAVLVVTNTASELADRLDEANLPPYRIAISNLSFLNPLKILDVARLLKARNIHTIFLNLSTDVKIAGIAAKLAGVQQIIYRRGIALPIKNNFLNRFLYRQIVTHIIANSQESKRAIIEGMPQLFAPENIQVIYNGIDFAEYDQKHSAHIYVKDTDEIVLGSAGRLSEEKGQKMLLELAAAVRQTGVKSTLLIAGKGELEDDLRAYAEQIQVADNVIFLGFIDPIKDFLETIDIFVLPSLREGGANVVLEAMAAAKPIVAFHASSNPEFIIHGETGLLAAPGNIAEFAAHIKTLSENDALRLQLGRNARKRVEETFTIQRTLENVVHVIEA